MMHPPQAPQAIDRQKPGPRTGPRPLPLHMALQTLTWLSSLAALGALKNGSLPWRPGLAKAAGELGKSLDAADPEAFAAAVDAEARRRLRAFTDGVARYRRHPDSARPPAPPQFWADGSTRVLDYGACVGTAARDGAPVLVVPSLINRGYILDLTGKRSLLRFLAAEGLRPFLVDWGAPGPEESRFGLTDYVCRRLEPVLDEVAHATGRTPAVLGYCMGGLLALALAARRPDRVAALALLATPWDFHAGVATKVRMLKAMVPGLAAMIDRMGELPVDVIQAMFTSLDPFLTADKFRRFSTLDAKSERARHFVALENWLNDGVPLVAPVARECLFDWYVGNAPARNNWRIGGRPVLAADVEAPTLVVIPENDHIVPPGSALALARAIPGAASTTVAAGHIGMVAGGRARSMLFQPLARWFGDTLTVNN